MRKPLVFVFSMLIAVLATTAARAAGPTVQVNPATPVLGDAVTFSGCGYTPGQGVNVTVTGPEATSFLGALAGADGCFDTAGVSTLPIYVPGVYEVQTQQGKGRKLSASLTFTVS